jgi:hypothetical protein
MPLNFQHAARQAKFDSWSYYVDGGEPYVVSIFPAGFFDPGSISLLRPCRYRSL